MKAHYHKGRRSACFDSGCQRYTPDERCCYCYEGIEHTREEHKEALWWCGKDITKTWAAS